MIDFDNISKTKAMSYANYIAKLLNFMTDETRIDDILYTPYAYE